MPDTRRIHSNPSDWRKFVREHLATQALNACEEIVEELAAHLQEIYEEGLARGLNNDAARQLAIEEVEDWNIFARNISLAKFKEGPMNARTKSLWLPALASLFASSLFLFVLTEISLQPRLLARLNSGLAQRFYALWIIGQIAFGALGARLSRRAGGSRLARTIAGTFPAIVMLTLCTIVIPVSALMQHNEFIFRNPGRLWWGAFLWAVVPAVTLLLGAAPFLQEPTRRRV
jgi:hypothetical protein